MRIPGQKHRLTKDHLAWMRIPTRFWEAAFDQIPDPNLKEDIRLYLRNIDTALDRGDGLLIWGANGLGKSHAAAIVAMECRRHGASVLFVTVETLRLAHFEKEKFDGDLLLTERANQVDVLVLDELGKETSGEKSTWSESMVENLLRVRSSFRRTTIITTNMNPQSMEARYRLSMMEILLENCLPIRAEGESQRVDASRALRERYTAKTG